MPTHTLLIKKRNNFLLVLLILTIKLDIVFIDISMSSPVIKSLVEGLEIVLVEAFDILVVVAVVGAYHYLRFVYRTFQGIQKHFLRSRKNLKKR